MMFCKVKFCIIPYIYKGMYVVSGLKGLVKKFDWAFMDHMWSKFMVPENTMYVLP